MRGVPDEHRPVFALAKEQLEAKGHRVFSPPDRADELKRGFGVDWHGDPDRSPTIRDFLLIDSIWILTQADLVLTLMPTWRDSQGCQAEVALAIAAGIPVNHASWAEDMSLVF